MSKPEINDIENSEISVNYFVSKTAHYFKIAGLQFFKEKGFKVTPEQFAILFILYKDDGLYQRQLGKIAFKDRPNITRLVDILDKIGLVRREIDVNDRRIIKVFITDKGKKEVETIYPYILEIRGKAMNGVTAEDEQILRNILDKIRNNLDETFRFQI